MIHLASPKLHRTALTGVLALVGTGAVLVATSGTPAMALCKYGNPNCVNPHVGSPVLTGNSGVKIPDSGWEDPDCKYYGNCHAARRVQTRADIMRPDPRVTTYPGNLAGNPTPDPRVTTYPGNLAGNPTRVTGTVRDHRGPRGASQGGVTVTTTPQPPIVRDHRTSNVVVRDHRDRR